jgi:hypothetical protein
MKLNVYVIYIGFIFKNIYSGYSGSQLSKIQEPHPASEEGAMMYLIEAKTAISV